MVSWLFHNPVVQISFDHTHSTVIARSLLLVDEVMKAGMSSLKG